MYVKFFSFILLVNLSVGKDDFLSKFHQNAYKIKDYRLELASYDKNFFNIFKVVTFKYNRTTIAINVTVNTKNNVYDTNLEVLIQCYKRASNEYRIFPIRYQVNAQKMHKANVLGYRENIPKCGNAKDVNFLKNVTYHICNMVPNERLLPPLIPTGQYKILTYLLYPEKEIAVTAGYLEIYVPFKYPSK